MNSWTARRQGPWVVVGLVAVPAALAVGVLVAGLGGSQTSIGPLDRLLGITTDVPVAAVLMVFAALALAPVLVRRWQAAVGVFLVWLVLEDLVRKLAGNDLRVYFVKDLLFVIVLIAVAKINERRVLDLWRTHVGSAGVPLVALVVWAVAMSVPTGLDDARVPLTGFRLTFMYAPLVLVGATMARSDASRWLRFLAIVGAAAAATGVLQALLGPGFLAPTAPVANLPGLNIVRGFSDTGLVVRPTGTFVDAGRYAVMSIIAFALAAASVLESRSRRRLVLAAALGLVAAAAVWIAGSRGAVVQGSAIATVAILASLASRRSSLGRAAVVAGLVLAAVVVLGQFAPSLVGSRAAFYETTLDPRSDRSEWGTRWANHSKDTLQGIQIGGLVGLGTGSESLGRQYLRSGADASVEYRAEAGYGSIAIEWGMVGLALWCAWMWAWMRRGWRAVRSVRGTRWAAVGLVLWFWSFLTVVINLFGGIAVFQNYVTNTYFWLLSGFIFAMPTAVSDERRATADRAS